MNSSEQTLAPGVRFRVRFEGSPREMDIVGYYCPNPLCTCQEATLFFYEADSSFGTKLIKLVLDYGTWRLLSTEIYKQDDDYALIIHEFMNALDEETKSFILSGKKAASADSLMRDDINYSSMSIDSLVCYSEIFYEDPLEQWLFSSEGIHYIVSDYYCPNPECDCRDVLLVFRKTGKEASLDTPALFCRIKFETGKWVIEEKGKGVSLKTARGLYDKFTTCLQGNGFEQLEKRYDSIKKWGKDYLLRYLRSQRRPVVSAKQKVSRNSPCPCGSGKKYKNCCGR